MISADLLFDFFQIVIIDVSLAGDNAIVIGMAAAGLPQEQRKKAVLYGLIGATALRIVLAIFAVHLLHVTGLMLAGGLLLLWVTWKMFKEIQHEAAMRKGKANAGDKADKTIPQPKKMSAAIWQILVADVGMSLDNVLAVAGAAEDHIYLLAGGLILSIALMGFAANAVVRLLHRYHWLAWLGLITVLYVALNMIWKGVHEFI